MFTVKSVCELQHNALEINVGDQVERLDQLVHGANGEDYFARTFITDGMKTLLSKGIARLAGKSNDAVFHLKQAMGGGKTHLIVGFGLLAKDPVLRKAKIPDIPHHDSFRSARVAVFDGRNNPRSYFWGEAARQLGNEKLFREYWESGAKAPDETAWLTLFEGDEPVLILLDEMPAYFQYYSTQPLGMGTIADVITRAFANMLTAASKRKNVCIVVSDLAAAYDTGGRLIQKALDDARQELGRAEISITPVNLESNEIYEIMRKRLFTTLPDSSKTAEIAALYANRLSEAAKAKVVERTAESLAGEIEMTYPFHPSFKHIVALFKENEKFRQTRGLMELVSRLLKSVWQSHEDIYLIGAQHFDLSLYEVREKLADISGMRDIIAKDLWDSGGGAHAQVIDAESGGNHARQVGALLLAASLSTGVNAVKGLTQSEMLEYLIDPLNQTAACKKAFDMLDKKAWYLHHTPEGRAYFDHSENLTKRLQGYAKNAPQNKIDDLIRHRLEEMYRPVTREAYEKLLPLPEMDDASALLKSHRTMLIIDPDGKIPPEIIDRFYRGLVNKNNLLVLTGERSSMPDLDAAARHLYAAEKADKEIKQDHPQRIELDERRAQYEQDFTSTILNVFDKLVFPGHDPNRGDVLRSKPLDRTYATGETYNGERQVIKTLTANPRKLYVDISEDYDALRTRAEILLFGGQESMTRLELNDRARQLTQMPWLPLKGLDSLIHEACKRGQWDDLGNGFITKTPRPRATEVSVIPETNPDDSGTVRLRVSSSNAGSSPVLYYLEGEEDDEALIEKNGKILSDEVLSTNALKATFLAVDSSGKSPTGKPRVWINKLTIRNKFDEASRKLELLVAPRGEIRFTLDGSEPRHGTKYEGPFLLGDDVTQVEVFAECEGLEEKRRFTFPARGKKEIPLKRDSPAQLHTSASPKRLDNATKTYRALKMAQERNIGFDGVNISIGSNIHLTVTELPVQADFIEKTLSSLQALLPADAPVVMSFKKAIFQTGFDLEQFVQEFGIELKSGEVLQD